MIHPENKRTGNRYTNIAAFMAAKDVRESVYSVYTNGKLLVFYNNQWMTNEAFLSVTPDPESLLIKTNHKGENCCKRVGNIS